MSTMRNSVMMIGRATKPVVDSERGQATFKLVVTESFQKTCATNTFDCVATGNMVQSVARNVKQGQQVAIDGSLRNHDYTDLLRQAVGSPRRGTAHRNSRSGCGKSDRVRTPTPPPRNRTMRHASLFSGIGGPEVLPCPRRLWLPCFQMERGRIKTQNDPKTDR